MIHGSYTPDQGIIIIIIMIMMYTRNERPSGHPLARVKRRRAHSDYITKYRRPYNY